MSPFPKLARYQVLGRLATGGMAEVWLGRAVGFGGFEKLVVLKTILPNLVTNPQFVQMFINEARVAAMLNHPNCVQIFELGKEDENLYIAMEYIEGFSLSRLLKRAKAKGVKVPLDVLARIAADALTGLDYAHKLTDREGRAVGLIHRDVSPDNLLISFTGQTKLVDFGIAKASLSAAAATRAGTVKGKFGYIAPEYLRGQQIDARADLFALGVVLYRAITGKRPFVGPTEAATSIAVLQDTPVWPSDVDRSLPQAMSAMVMMALEKDPNARFASAKAMRQAIEAATRPADVDVVAALLGRLWPPGDPERVALESLAAGHTEETSEPALESVISQGFELPPGVLHTPRPSFAEAKAPLLGPEPDTGSGASPLGPDGNATRVVAPQSLAPPAPAIAPAAVPRAVNDDDDDEPPRKRGARWAVLVLSVLLGGVGVWKMKHSLRPVAPASTPAAPSPAPSATAVPAAAATSASVSVEVDQPVTVFALGKELGKAPGPFELPAGPVTLHLVGPGVDQDHSLVLVAGEPFTLTELKKGTLSLKVEPWAYVKIDGKSAGQTPVRRELTEGPHTLELSNTELNVNRRVEFQVKSGENKPLSFNLEE